MSKRQNKASRANKAMSGSKSQRMEYSKVNNTENKCK